MASEQFSLCWDNFHKNMSSGMNSLLESEDLVDVTLAVEGKFLKAHKMVLSVCSPYFKELFKSNPCQHPIVFMKDVSYVAISDLLQFMYQGEVQVSQDNLTTFIKTAEALQIKGLTGDGNGSTDADSEPVQEKPLTRHVEETYKPTPRPKKQLPAPVVTTTPTPKRPRLSVSSNDSQSAPAPVTKTEPVSTPVSGGDSVQFKVEPYDQNQAVTIPDDTGDENFGDDTLDDNMVDDNEDYSMMEGEEPQAGTSADGTGEGQEERIRATSGCVVIDGFTYHQNSSNPSSDVRYLLCSEYKRLACKARARIDCGNTSDIVVTSRHNHPPTPATSRKIEFVGLIKQCITQQASDTPLKVIYNLVAEIYLSCAEFRKTGCRGRATIPFDGTIDELRVTQQHSHPPDGLAAERLEFLIDLKNSVRYMEAATLKQVYNTISEKYLKCAMLKEVNCKASYVLKLDQHGLEQETYHCVTPHNHPPNALTLESSRFLAELERAIQIMPGSTKQIFDRVIQGYPGVKAVYTYSNVVGRMHHWLKKYKVHGKARSTKVPDFPLADDTQALL